jgi:hypothetical protein
MQLHIRTPVFNLGKEPCKPFNSRILSGQPITTWLRTHSQALTTLFEEKINETFQNFGICCTTCVQPRFQYIAGDVDVPGAPAPPPPPRLTTTYEDPLITCTDTQNTEVVTSEPSDYLFYEALVALLSVY